MVSLRITVFVIKPEPSGTKNTVPVGTDFLETGGGKNNNNKPTADHCFLTKHLLHIFSGRRFDGSKQARRRRRLLQTSGPKPSRASLSRGHDLTRPFPSCHLNTFSNRAISHTQTHLNKKPAGKSAHTVLSDVNTLTYSSVARHDWIRKIICFHTQQFIKASHLKV